MRRPHRHPRPVPSSEAGFTLVELLVGATLSVLVLGAIVTFLLTGLRQSTNAAARADALDRATFGMEQLKQELRTALELSPAVATDTPRDVLDARRWVKDAGGFTQRWIRYDCAASGTRAGTDACVRRDLTTNATTMIIDGISPSAAPVFTLRAARPPALTGQVLLDVATHVPGATNPVLLRSSVTPRACADGPPSGSTTCPG